MSKSQNTTTVEPIAAPSTSVAPITPEFIRLPKPGQLEPHCGLTRSKLNELILGAKPVVKSICLRKRGAARGVRLIVFKSLMDYLRSQLKRA